MLQVRAFFLSALVYTARAGVLHGDSYSSPPLSAPPASYDAPAAHYGSSASSSSYDTTHIHSSSGGDFGGHGDAHHSAPLSSYSGGAISGPALSGPGYSSAGSSYDQGSLPLGDGLSSGGFAGASTSVGSPRVIGSSVSVGRPIAAATRYELQSVVQDVIRRVPVEVTRHVQVAVPVPQPYPVRQEVKVPVPKPYPVHVDVVKHVPYDVYKTEHVEVERPVPYEVIKKVPFEVIRKVHIPVEKPYEVIKKVHVPIEKVIEVPVAVWKPYPIHIIKHVTHYKKKGWW